jgi:hypothetical protein
MAVYKMHDITVDCCRATGCNKACTRIEHASMIKHRVVFDTAQTTQQ